MLSVSTPNELFPALGFVFISLLLAELSHLSFATYPSLVVLNAKPQPNSAAIDIFGNIKYSTPTKPLAPKPIVVPFLFSSSLDETAIDTKGKFYYDRPAGRVYIWPFDTDNDPTTNLIECSKRRTVRIASVSNIVFQNFTVMHSYHDGFNLH